MAFGPGSIAFTGFNADGNDNLSFAVLENIAAGTVITFTDSEWSGSAFNAGENTWTWTAGSDIAAGTVVAMDNLAAGQTAASNTGAIAFTEEGTRGLDTAVAVVYAYIGDPSTPTFLTALSNGPVNSAAGRLTKTGLTAGTNALSFAAGTNNDIAVYNGPRVTGEVIGNLAASIFDRANWVTQNTNGAGNDTLTAAADLQGDLDIDAGDGDDVVNGGRGDDVIRGGMGGDVIEGRAGDDELDGGEGNDTLKGGDGDDTLLGGAGNDLLSGGGGDDALDGGEGSDTAVYSDDTSGVVVDLAAGEAGGDDIGADTLTNIENVTGGKGADTITGNDAANILRGGDSADVIDGGAGNDTIHGDAGSDTIHGGEGDDRIHAGGSADYVYGDAGNDLVYGSDGNDEVRGGDDSDQLHGEGGDDKLFGDAGNDTLYGGIGSDTLSGGAGNDGVYGQDGNDTLIGGAGFDKLHGGAGTDTADYSADTGGIYIRLDRGWAMAQADRLPVWSDLVAGINANTIEHDDLIEIENITGTEFDDAIVGDNGANIIRSLGGNDQIAGLGGNDQLYGGAGDDVVDGGEGNDVLHGGGGDDVILAGLGNDTIDGGEGFDILDLSSATGPVRVNRGAGSISGAGIGTDTFSNIEKLLFGAGNDTVIGGNGADNFDGGAGNDVLTGRDGHDTLSGGAGCDVLSGGSGNDSLSGGDGHDLISGGSGDDDIDGGAGTDIIEGGSGDDVISAGAGNDIVLAGSGDDEISGGEGNDILTGGSGHDAFTFAAGFGRDRILDFKTTGSNSDVLEFSSDIFADFASAIAAADQAGRNVVFTIDNDTSLTLTGVSLASLQADDFRFV